MRPGERTRTNAIERIRGAKPDCERHGEGFAVCPAIAGRAQGLAFDTCLRLRHSDLNIPTSQPIELSKGNTQITMQTYRIETSEILRQFIADEITHGECFVGLDVAFAALVPRLTDDQIEPVRNIFLANIEAVERELKRRKRRTKVPFDTTRLNHRLTACR